MLWPMLARLGTRVPLVTCLVAAAAATAVVATRTPTARPLHDVILHAKLQPSAAASAPPDSAVQIVPEFGPTVTGDLARWRTITVRTTRPDADVLADFVREGVFEDAFLEPAFSLPSRGAPVERAADKSCPIATPSFESYQGYLGPAPAGIDAPSAWQRGVRGAGEQFADVEGGWNAAHEDLVGERIEHVAGRPIRGWREHGTAVLGEVVGKDNGRGVVGIAPDVDRVFTASIDGPGVAGAIEAAAERLRAGDVLLVELQSTGPAGAYIAVEYWGDVYDVIHAATARGVVVIEAAGNGFEDLDRKVYRGRFDRTKRDSGAIVVGAGGPPRPGFIDRARLDFSNYGKRVDVQGWGRKVATLDYGDLQACDAAADRHYTGEFSGTSSASPIVAGAALLVEASARARGKVLAPREVRDLLIRSGTPQVGDLKEHIGPRPDLARALSQP